MKVHDRNYFLDQVNAIEAKDLNGRHIELITEICTTMRGAKINSEVIEKGLDMLWKIAMNSDNGCTLLIVNRAALGFSDILSRMGII